VLYEAATEPVLITGTPGGIDADYVGDIMEENIFTLTIGDAVKQGLLCPYDLIIPTDIGDAGRNENDLNAEQQKTLIHEKAEFAVTTAMRNNRRNIIAYATTKVEAQILMENMRGECETHKIDGQFRLITADTSAADRAEARNWFAVTENRASVMRVIVNINILTEGKQMMKR